MHRPGYHSTCTTYVSQSSCQLRGGRRECALACPGSRHGHFRSLQPGECCLCSLPITQAWVAEDALPSFCNRGQRHFSVKLHSNFPANSYLSLCCGDPGSQHRFQWPRFCASCKRPVSTTWNLSVVSSSTYQAGSCFEALMAAQTCQHKRSSRFCPFS